MSKISLRSIESKTYQTPVPTRDSISFKEHGVSYDAIDIYFSLEDAIKIKNKINLKLK